ncbi:MAG: cupin domain-containing protein [Acidimicrobiales bacterium]
MQYVRSLDQAPAAHLSHASGVDTAVIAQLESVTALGRTYRPGGGDPVPQCSPGDVYLFVTDGNLGWRWTVGSWRWAPRPWRSSSPGPPTWSATSRRAEARALVLVSAVTAGGRRPVRTRRRPRPHPQPGGRRRGVRRGVGGGRLRRRLPTERLRRADHGRRALRRAHLHHERAAVNAGGEGPAVHIHTFDQLFFVVRGRLHVRVALEEVVAATHELVVLPAGVPHTQWNEGPDTEVHLAVLTPAPPAGEPLTRPVTFGPPTD